LILPLRQHPPEACVVGLDGLHCLDDGMGAVIRIGQIDQVIKLGMGPEEDGASLGEVLFGQLSGFAATRGQIGLDISFDGEIPVVGVPEEDQAHDRQEIFIAGVVGIGPQGIRGTPKSALNCLDMLQLPHTLPLYSCLSVL
jgi:hypothetical protein